MDGDGADGDGPDRGDTDRGGTDSGGTDSGGTDGVVLVGEQSGRTSHYVDSVQAAAAALGGTPRALCRRAFRPAALTAPLGRLCPACAAAHHALTTVPPRRRPCRSFLRRSFLRRSILRRKP